MHNYLSVFDFSYDLSQMFVIVIIKVYLTRHSDENMIYVGIISFCWKIKKKPAS
jgi:hypothetical protein